VSQDADKKVDESWKSSVEKEKHEASPTEKPASLPEVDFLGFVSTLAMQALTAMGEVPQGQTGEPQMDLLQARYLIDIIQLLSEKTKGNLSAAEESELKTLLYELRIKYVKKSQGVFE
jgi:hypothetical protein